MPGPSFIEHGGKQILLQDFANVSSVAEGLRAIAATRAFAAAHGARPGAPKLLVLTTVEGSIFDPAVVDAMKELALHNKPYVHASAVVGLNPIKRVMFRMVVLFSGRAISAFETREQALDWLVRQ